MSDRKQAQISLDSWFAEYHDAIFRYCNINTRNRALASDITQECFVRLWRYLCEGKDITHPQALLYRIAKNLIIDNSRKKKSSSLDSMIESYGDTIADKQSEARKEKDERIDMILDAMNDISENYREMITLRYIEGMSVNDIAQIIGTKPNTISVRLHRAVKELKEAMNKNN